MINSNITLTMNRYMFLLSSLILVDLDNINPDKYANIVEFGKIKAQNKAKDQVCLYAISIEKVILKLLMTLKLLRCPSDVTTCQKFNGSKSR